MHCGLPVLPMLLLRHQWGQPKRRRTILSYLFRHTGPLLPERCCRCACGHCSQRRPKIHHKSRLRLTSAEPRLLYAFPSKREVVIGLIVSCQTGVDSYAATVVPDEESRSAVLAEEKLRAIDACKRLAISVDEADEKRSVKELYALVRAAKVAKAEGDTRDLA